MITTLPQAITNVEEAKAFLKALNDNRESYHPEDNAKEIVWRCGEPSELEKDQLNKLMGDINNLEGFDPCQFLLELDPSYSESLD